MASSWSPDDFQAPFGLLRASMFPQEADLGEKIGKYLDEAEIKASTLSGDALDGAVECWVYYRAFMAAHVDYNAEPNVNSFADQGSEEYGQSQIDNWRKLAENYLLRFNNLVATGADTFASLPRTTSVKTQVDWI